MTFETLLAELNMTKSAFAESLGLSKVTVFRWGDTPPKYAMAYLELAYKVKSLANSI